MANNSKREKVKFSNKGIAILILFFLIILLGGIYFIFFFINDVSNNNKNNDEKVKTPEVIELTEEEKKLAKLDNIDKKLDFFKMENLDRYLNYKELNPDLDVEKIIVYVNIGLDQEFYTNTLSSPNQDTETVLANKFYYLSQDFVPQNLETINSAYSSGNKLMVASAKDAFEEMAKNAKNDGYNIRAVSAYRSYDYQANLYSNYAKSDGTAKADTYSARAGFSEHQTGLAVDVDNRKVSYTSFGDTEEFKWMQENAYKFGFILRYTKDNEPITGYKNEPWHYRYVGVEISTYIHNNSMTYEEYYVRFLEK